MLIMPSFKKSLIVEQFQGNYLKLVRTFPSYLTVSTLIRQSKKAIQSHGSTFVELDDTMNA